MASFISPQERDALVLELRHLASRLTRAGLMSAASSRRLMCAINGQRSKVEDARHALPKLVLEILLCLEDGTLSAPEHYVPVGDDRVALHLESVAAAMFRAKRSSLTARHMGRLFHFGWLQVPEVVVARSARTVFGAEQRRRRAVILHLPSAQQFVRPLSFSLSDSAGQTCVYPLEDPLNNATRRAHTRDSKIAEPSRGGA